MEDSGTPRLEAGRVLAGREARAPGLDADQLDPRVAEERPEEADGVRPAADAGDEGVGELPPSSFRIWARASRPMTSWKSRTIAGKGCGPSTEPRT